MHVRRAVPDDALAISKARVDSWRSAYRGLLPDETLAGLDHVRGAGRFRKSIEDGSEDIYVVEDTAGAGIVGFFVLGPCRDRGIDKATGEVYALYLTQGYWRKGIGRSLYRKAENLLKLGGYSRAVLWVLEGNTPARLFYEAMGFTADGTAGVLDMGTPVNTVRYSKAI